MVYVGSYEWQIGLERILILPLAPCGFDTPYLSLPPLGIATMILCTWGLSLPLPLGLLGESLNFVGRRRCSILEGAALGALGLGGAWGGDGGEGGPLALASNFSLRCWMLAAAMFCSRRAPMSCGDALTLSMWYSSCRHPSHLATVRHLQSRRGGSGLFRRWCTGCAVPGPVGAWRWHALLVWALLFFEPM